jgi:glucose-1-phosphate thymidylyltransferase
MKCLILAAGFCTRLFPITEYYPKALLTVGGRAILDYILSDVIQNPMIDSIALITNHRYPDIFRIWVKTMYPNQNITVIDNGVMSPETRLGAIGDMQLALKTLKWQDDILVLASDTISSIHLNDFVDFFGKNRGVVNAVYDTKDKEIIRKKLGCLNITGNKIIRFDEKPENPATTITSIPFYIYPKETLKFISEYLKTGASADAPGSIISWLVGKIDCFAYNIRDGYYFDVGTIEMYNRLAKMGIPKL